MLIAYICKKNADMGFQHFWYLLLLVVVAAVSVYLLLKKIKNLLAGLKYILPAFILTGAISAIISTRFLQAEAIGFNYAFLTGRAILGLPVEEWLFPAAVSLLTFAVYLMVKVNFGDFEKPNLFVAISLVILVGFGLITWFSRTKPLSFFVFFLTTIYLGYTIFRNRFKKHLAKFYLALFISLIPYFLLKGIINSLPVILYNNEYILGIGLFGVPVEDFGYFFLLALMNITIYEFLRERNFY